MTSSKQVVFWKECEGQAPKERSGIMHTEQSKEDEEHLCKT